jgi:uncharacterized protein (TIGR02246 family)
VLRAGTSRAPGCKFVATLPLYRCRVGGLKIMANDEQQIRGLVEKWLAATRAGDTATVLKLMSDDVVFLVPGVEPFGKDVFAANSANMKGFRIEGISEIQELKILGDWAWMRTRLRVAVTPPNGKEMVRSGYTLTILRKEPDGRWVLVRDANLLTETKS